jgi:hypothetical protein
VTEFEDRLQKAIDRGRKSRDVADQEAAGRAMSEEECKRVHARYRLQLSEHIERCLHKLPDHFPGFRFETVVGERGWGAACSRDDVGILDGVRRNLFSRLEMTVRPYSQLRVLEIWAKGTIRDREVFNRTQYQKLSEVDVQPLFDSIDLWVLEYAEKYSAAR